MTIFDELDALKQERRQHEQAWKDCFDYTYPRRAAGLVGGPVDTDQAKSTKARFSNSTATEAVRTLAAAIMAGTTPANSLWVGYSVNDAKMGGPEKAFLDNAARVVWQNIHAATWDADGYEATIDMVIAGWGPVYVDEAPDGGYRFVQWPVSQVFTASTNATNVPDTVFRTYDLTAQQAVTEFGLDNLGKEIQAAYRNGDRNKFQFVHCIKPRSGKRGPLATQLPFASYKGSVADKRILSEGGYHEMPVIISRWMAIPDSTYADGPVFEALPVIKRLNELERMELASADIAVGGMWLVRNDGVVNPRTIKVGGRVVIPVTDVNESMKELKTGANYQMAEYMIKGMQQQIRRVLMADQLEPLDGPTKTATEIHARMNLLRQLLGPVYGRMQAERLGPLVTRCFGIAYRAGALGELPEGLRGKTANIVYLSPLARAQKLEEVSAIERLYQYGTAVGQAKPEIMDNFDEDASLRFVADALVVPHQVLRPESQVRDLRAQREQEQAQQNPAMNELLMKGAKTAVSKMAANAVPEA